MDELDDRTLAAVRNELLSVLDPKWLGPRKFLYCYRPLNGGCPAKGFLDSLTPETQASYGVSFTRFSSEGQERGERHHVWTERENEGLAAFKNNQSKTRIVHTTDHGNTVVLLFGFGGKKEDKVDQVHVNEARRLRDEYRARRAVIEARVRATMKRGR